MKVLAKKNIVIGMIQENYVMINFVQIIQTKNNVMQYHFVFGLIINVS